MATEVHQTPEATAKSALADSVRLLLEGKDFDDLNWLPSDFSDRLLAISWKHRADVDGARFKRELRAYIRGLAPAAEGES